MLILAQHPLVGGEVGRLEPLVVGILGAEAGDQHRILVVQSRMASVSWAAS